MDIGLSYDSEYFVLNIQNSKILNNLTNQTNNHKNKNLSNKSKPVQSNTIFTRWGIITEVKIF